MSIVEMKVPQVGESITEVTVANWIKKEGDFVKIDEVLCELESDKATFELTAEKSGILRILAASGTTLPIGAPICNIDTAGVVSAPTVVPTSTSETVLQNTSASTASTKASFDYAVGTPSPAASKILAEKGIDAGQIKGTGIDGRITKEDALNATPTPAASNGEVSKPAQAPAPTKGNRVQRREKMTSLRKTVSRRLVAVKNETAMLTTFNEVNMKPIMDLRSKLKDDFEKKHGVKLGFMSFFVKACCQALMDFPAVNAYIDGEEIVFNDYVDMSIAVSAPKGLVVPVLRNADTLSFKEIEAGIGELAKKARENKLTIEEMTGGTFTITNGGVFGSMLSTPIINAPQSAILGMHNIVERPVAENGQIVIRPIMYVALSYDHRIIDGRESVGFLVKVKQYLEDPARLLLGV